MKKLKSISMISIFVIYLALIRCLIEPFRLNYVDAKVDFQILKPLLLGALTSGLFTLIMGIYFYKGRFKLVIVLSVVCIIFLLVIKFVVA